MAEERKSWRESGLTEEEKQKKKGGKRRREGERKRAALCLSSPFECEERDWRPIVEIPFLTVLSDLINAGSAGQWRMLSV